MALRIRLGDRGRLVLPATIRRRLGLETGDVLIVDAVSEGELRLRVARHAIAELRGAYSVGDSEPSLVEELERARREEAEREARQEVGQTEDRAGSDHVRDEDGPDGDA
jgi:AbrB family looped-hinge helix DNA binding protein